MNVAYNEINCADAAKMIGVDYSTVAGWCRKGIINHANISDGDKGGRYLLKEDEVDYIKHLKQKFGKQFIRKYRKDWKKGMMPAKDDKPATTVKSMVVNITKEEPVKHRADIDEIAIKIGYIQDIKDKIAELEKEKLKLMEEHEKLKAEVMEYL